jgi:hypothetical protein
MKTLTWILFASLLTAGGVVWHRRLSSRVVAIPAPVRVITGQSNMRTHRTDSKPPARERYRSPWEAVNARDYRAFVELLREAGCPEETVLNFAIAAMGRGYTRRLEKSPSEKVRAARYWQVEASGGQAELPSAMRRARSEMDVMLNRLVQVSMSEVRDEIYRDAPDWLPKEKREPLQELLARQREDLQAVEQRGNPGATGGKLFQELRSEWKALREQHRSELEALLGTDGAAEYEARETSEANYVRENLPPARDEQEFKRWVQAARELGFTDMDVMEERMPNRTVSSEDGLPRLRERILEGAGASADPQRATELQAGLVDEARSADERRKTQDEQRSLADLQGLARAGGIALSEEEARAFHTALRQSSDELEQKWGKINPHELPEADQKVLKQRMREEMERIAVKTLGEKGRVLVEQIAKRSEKP